MWGSQSLSVKPTFQLQSFEKSRPHQVTSHFEAFQLYFQSEQSPCFVPLCRTRVLPPSSCWLHLIKTKLLHTSWILKQDQISIQIEPPRFYLLLGWVNQSLPCAQILSDPDLTNTKLQEVVTKTAFLIAATILTVWSFPMLDDLSLVNRLINQWVSTQVLLFNSRFSESLDPLNEFQLFTAQYRWWV